MRLSTGLLTAVLLLPALAPAQAPPPADDSTPPAPPADAPPPTAWSKNGWNISGYLDTFYIQNYNNPSGRLSQIQAFTYTSDKLSLNSLTGSLSYDPKPVGFRVDAGYGRTYDAFFLSEPKHTDWSRYLLNAYVTLKPAAWKGVQLDFGKFVTSAGAEVTESHLNWNYSRSILFAMGPYYHTGARLTVPVKPNWSLGAQAVTGWNLMRDNNSGKTYGFTSLNTYSKVVIANNYYTGPENNGTNKGWRNFYDLAVTLTPTSKLSAYFNYDVGKSKSPYAGSATFWGVAGAAKYQLTSRFAISPRLEYYSDTNGFWTGTPQAFKEFTLTGEAKINESFLTRVEWRRDMSDQPFFQVGPGLDPSKHQTLLMASFIVVLKPGLFNFGGR